MPFMSHWNRNVYILPKANIPIWLEANFIQYISVTQKNVPKDLLNVGHVCMRCMQTSRRVMRRRCGSPSSRRGCRRRSVREHRVERRKSGPARGWRVRMGVSLGEGKWQWCQRRPNPRHSGSENARLKQSQILLLKKSLKSFNSKRNFKEAKI